MISALLSPRLLIGLAFAVALGVAYIKGRSDGAAPAVAKLERERTAWANERTKAAELHAKALEAEIARHNKTVNELEADHANAEARRAVAEKGAVQAAAAASAAERGSRRLRDAIESNRLATSAALEAAGATANCAPATAAADLLRGVLSRLDAAAGELADGARASGLDADRQHAASSECADRATTMIRNSN